MGNSARKETLLHVNKPLVRLLNQNLQKEEAKPNNIVEEKTFRRAIKIKWPVTYRVLSNKV